MGHKKHSDTFWLSYSDLMTSLFFIMLVLFIVCIIKMKGTQNKLQDIVDGQKVEVERLNSILQLEAQFKELSKSSTLRYDEEHKTFIAKDFEGIEIFVSESDKIKPEYLAKVDAVGRDLEKVLKALNDSNKDFRYLLIIEGNAANSYAHPMNIDKEYTYNLSYKRSLALYYRWTKVDHIDLRQYNTEIQICGSGLNGINRDKRNEDNNKRFVIQIIPKISRPALN
ncbi:MAG: flagellar motor protein MotB [Bacteroides sp.]|nr:flagellar motor protein MotB [Bacteroides sp.]